MELIDRYVYAVTRLLPQTQRSEIEAELRSNIQDMVDAENGGNDERVRKVLESLGRPEMLAMRYSEKKQYLIGPEWYVSYMRVLKAIVIVAFFVALGIYTMKYLSTDQSIVGKGISIILGTLNGTILAASLVTLAFIFFEHSKTHQSRHQEVAAWSVDELPQLPRDYKTHKN